MKTLVWHWGRRGAGPIFAARLAGAINTLPGQQAVLSLPDTAEILSGPDAPFCAWREPTYETGLGYLGQRLLNPVLRGRTTRHLDALGPDLALCAMPALLDARMLAGLQAHNIPYGVIVHDAAAHPGDHLSFQALDQRKALAGARHLFCLTGHVAEELRRQGFGRNGQSLTKLWHPPLGLTAPPAARRPGMPVHILHFGRLLPYKGLDLLAAALELLGPEPGFLLRICGEGPNSSILTRLAALPGVTVENRWFAEAEVPGLLGWADALVLPYREASQSGVAALAIEAGRHVLATNVGGLPEQLGHQPAAVLCAPEAPAIAAGLRALIIRLAANPILPPDAVSPPGWRDMAAAILAVMADYQADETAKSSIFAT